MTQADARPIEERFDVTYVRHRHGPDRANRWLVWLVLGGGGGLLALLGVRGDHRLYSSGGLADVHAGFGNDCAQCHQPAANGQANYFLPVSDDACLRCHAAVEHSSNQSKFSADLGLTIPGHSEPVSMSTNCASCHIEHRGASADLTMIPDRICIDCHADLAADGYAEPASDLAVQEETEP